jgi:hypothetical protein
MFFTFNCYSQSSKMFGFRYFPTFSNELRISNFAAEKFADS